MKKNSKLLQLSNECRKDLVKLIFNSKTSHLGSSLSCIDIIVSIYFSKFGLKGSINNKKKLKNTFILSKGHAAPALYVVMNKKGLLSNSKLKNYCKPGSYLEEHPNIKIDGVIVSSGSLGHGLSYSAGISLADKINNKNYKHIVLMSDGECNEGSVWEAGMFIPAKKIENILVFIDCNKWQATERTKDIMAFEPIKKKWQAFGWFVKEIDGHNFDDIEKCLRDFHLKKKPTVVVCRTTKGKGVSFMEDDNLWHYRAPNQKEYEKAIKELEKKF